MKFLDRINSPDDLKKLNMSQLNEYASEIRDFLISTISDTGGHLASNLGVVELTIALHYVFNSPTDKIIWDVGHQAYIHKIITGRRDNFATLRKFGGLSGFPKTSESEHDIFNTGHSSTSVSAALGISRSMHLAKKDGRAIAVIGDGALTGGMAYEALCDAGQDKNGGMIVILNDNGMSISPNMSAIANHLNNLRSGGRYNRLKHKIADALETYPIIRNNLKNIKSAVRNTLLPTSFFEDIGFKYFGPYDGHNTAGLISAFRQIKQLPDNIVIHVITKKGKGYKPAERNPGKFHGIGRFDIETGITKPTVPDYSSVFGKKLLDMGRCNEKIIAITAAMPIGTGMGDFAINYPTRYFDVGIAEQHAVTMAGGMAKEGFVPVFAVYSSFLQRSYDQILHDIALQKLHVVFCIDRAGLACGDGETHHGLYDISFLLNMPNMTILAPSCFKEFEAMMDFAVNDISGPVAIRYPRGGEKGEIQHNTNIKSGGECIKDGDFVTIYALGNMVFDMLKVSEMLDTNGISAKVIDLRFACPINRDFIISNKGTINIVAEDGVCAAGHKIREILNSEIISFSYPDEAIPHGDEESIRDIYGLTTAKMAEKILNEVHKWKK